MVDEKTSLNCTSVALAAITTSQARVRMYEGIENWIQEFCTLRQQTVLFQSTVTTIKIFRMFSTLVKGKGYPKMYLS